MKTDFDTHDQPLCIVEFNNSVSEEWRAEVIQALHSVGKIATISAYTKWTVEPR